MEKKTLYRYFGNCATEEERIQVLEWTKASPENLKEFCRERNIYNAILLSTDNIQRTKYDFRRHYRRCHTIVVGSIRQFLSHDGRSHRSPLFIDRTGR